MFSTCITSTTNAGACQHSFNTCLLCLRCTWYRECRPTHQIPVQCWASWALQPIAGSMPVNHLRRWPSTNHHRVCCILCADTCHSTNTFSMLTHSLRNWPVIETAFGDCTVFSDCCIMLVTFKIPAPETPDNKRHWPNGDAGPTLFQPKPLRLLTTNIIVNIIILITC